MKKILIVEDDISLNKGIMLTLRSSDIEIYQAYDLNEAREKLNSIEIDLVLLDVNLSDGSGFDFCKEIKEKYNLQVIFLTACDMEIDVVTGFELGADDYITKPFSLMILRARVLTALKREVSKKELNNKFRFNNLILDFDKMEFKSNDELINLSKTEQKLLKILLTNKGNVISREQLIDKVWGYDGEFVDENALTVAVKRLRRKIGNKYIKTIYGIGYSWNVGGEHEE